MSELERLRAENAALREEVEAWRAHQSQEAAMERERDAIFRVSVALKIPNGKAKLLWRMCKRPEHVFRRAELAALFTRFDCDGGSEKTIDVYVTVIRPALTRIGLAGAIRTHWSEGYSITRTAAETILALGRAPALAA